MSTVPRIDAILADPAVERLATIAEIAAYEAPWDDATLYEPWTLQGRETT